MLKTADITGALFSEVGMAIKSRMQAAISLPFSQCQTLWFISEQTNPNMQDIARHFKIKAPSATFLVEELVRAGLLTRKANARDRRKVEVAMTPKGKRMFKIIQEKRNTILAKLFGSLDDKDRKELARILQKVIDSD